MLVFLFKISCVRCGFNMVGGFDFSNVVYH